MNAKHTPTPWTRDSIENLISSEDQDAINSFVRAVNAHEEFIEAFRQIVAFCDAAKRETQPSVFALGCVTPTGKAVLAENVLQIVRQAIAIAEGRYVCPYCSKKFAPGVKVHAYHCGQEAPVPEPLCQCGHASEHHPKADQCRYENSCSCTHYDPPEDLNA